MARYMAIIAIVLALVAVLAIGGGIAIRYVTLADPLSYSEFVAALMTLPILGKIRREDTDIKQVCTMLKMVVTVLDKPRRIKILQSLQIGVEKTFNELQEETGIPSGSLHGHLKALLSIGVIEKNDERPAKYRGTVCLEDMISLASDMQMEMISRVSGKASTDTKIVYTEKDSTKVIG